MPPRWKRSQSPTETAELHNSPKRQKRQNESKAKTDIEAVASSAKSEKGAEGSENRPFLIKSEWEIGLPFPISQIPLGFVPSLCFQPQIPTALPEGLMTEAVRNWSLSEYKTRPQFARLLLTETLPSNQQLLAAYLGFNTVRELYFFVDFEGKHLL